MICQCCGIEAPTRKVMFAQHIGAIVMFFHKRIGGHFCRNCINKYFGEYTGITAIAGWWGIISLFATPCVITFNIVNRLRAWGLEPVPAGATRPVLTDDVIARLQSHMSPLIERLNRGEDLMAVARGIAAQARVTPGQVVLFLQLLARAREQRPGR